MTDDDINLPSATTDEDMTDETAVVDERNEPSLAEPAEPEPSHADPDAPGPTDQHVGHADSTPTPLRDRRPDRSQQALTIAVLVLVVAAIVLLVISISNHEPSSGQNKRAIIPLASLTAATFAVSASTIPDEPIITALNERK